MRRFFSFKSSTSSSGNKSPSLDPPDPVNEKVYGEKLWEYDAKVPRGKKVHDSCNLYHGRSTSFSSLAACADFGEGIFNSSTDRSGSPSVQGNPPHLIAERSLCCHLRTPEIDVRASKGDVDNVRHSNAAENLNSPGSSGIHHCSSGDSAYSSPISLRCRSARLQQCKDSNRTLDFYIDGEHNEIKMSKESQHYFYNSGEKGHVAEDKELSCTGKQPRAFSTAPSSPTYSKEDLWTLREADGIHQHLFHVDRSAADVKPASQMYHNGKKFEQLMHLLCDKSSQDYDSETTMTAEDVSEDLSNPGLTSILTGTSQHSFTDFSTRENIYHCCDIEPLPCEKRSCVSEDGSVASKMGKLSLTGLQKQRTDEELIKKVKDVEHMLKTFSGEDRELENLLIGGLDGLTLLQTIRSITNDRRYLALELSAQIKCQIAQRSSTRDRLKQAKFELDTRTMRLEKEKNELQTSLEKELDRRSTNWSLKLEKIQSEEQRLRERVRELAEQNVSLQREISTLKGNEAGTRSRIISSEMQMKDLASSLDTERTENHKLHQALKEVQERLNGTEEERNCMRQSLKKKEEENKELQRVVVRFGRMCREQDKTIDGLRQGYSNEIGQQSTESDDKVTLLQREQMRLTGVEQMLRKELESSIDELKSLRRENMCLLDHLQGTKTGTVFSSVKLDQELRDRVDCLQSQGVSLLNDHSILFGKILDLVKCRQYETIQEGGKYSHGYSVSDYAVNYQSLRRGIENFSRSLSVVSEALEKKSKLEVLECHLDTTQGGRQRQFKVPDSEVQLEVELKAEALITGVLREKLCSKELEIEQLQSDLASSIRAHEVLQTEVQRLQDELSRLTHKTKDVELQILKKDDSVNHLQHDLHECKMDLASTRGILMTVTEERDHMWEEVKHSKETIMLLNLEVCSLKKKVEGLEERVLIKEGEIAILKDSMVVRSFDTIYSPKSVKDFSLNE